MAKTKKTEIKEKSIESLKEDLKEKRNELFKAKLDHTKGNLKNTSSMTNMKKDIARILTAISMKSAEVKTAADKKEVKNG